jgi:hypothetical protein
VLKWFHATRRNILEIQLAADLNEMMKASEQRRRKAAADDDNQMRKVIYAINITLDGCCGHTKQIADDETHEYFTHLIRRDVDLFVFGRQNLSVDGSLLA